MEVAVIISITELTKIFKITTRTIRYYEEIGLIEKATRIGGIRHYSREPVLERINDIFFLKSLGYKLSYVKLILNNSFYVKPILVNIRLSLLYKQINTLHAEIIELKKYLDKYDWPEVSIENILLLEDMEERSAELLALEKAIMEEPQITKKDILSIVSCYKEWHQTIGFNLTEDHLTVIASNPEIQFQNEKVKEIFQKYLKQKK
jgi:DNA-binding transcriptional MerR regulator